MKLCPLVVLFLPAAAENRGIAFLTKTFPFFHSFINFSITFANNCTQLEFELYKMDQDQDLVSDGGTPLEQK